MWFAVFDDSDFLGKICMIREKNLSGCAFGATRLSYILPDPYSFAFLLLSFLDQSFSRSMSISSIGSEMNRKLLISPFVQ
jgi:hypothetical protein